MKLAQRLAIGYIRTKFKLLSSISKKKAAAQAFELFCTPLTDVFKVREENYPHIRFVITKGLGHRRIYRENKVSREVIDFM